MLFRVDFEPTAKSPSSVRQPARCLRMPGHRRGCGCVPFSTRTLMMPPVVKLEKAQFHNEYKCVQFLRICHWTPVPSELLEGDAILFPYL
jgi:hypothetical protein